MSRRQPRALGIDPGTVSFDICGREGGRVVVDQTFATEDVAADPGVLLDALHAAGDVDLIVGPSGYGLPWVAAADVGERELGLMLLSDGRGGGGDTIIGGMGRLLRALGDSGLPVCLAPGVIHLASVPEHRKANRVDMGTADKVCAAALCVWDQARRLGLSYPETSFVSLEAGGAFTAVIGVEGGAIVDGDGGTSGAMGFAAAGALDGEVAYLLRDFAKGSLASGGVASIAGAAHARPAELAEARDAPRVAMAWDAFFEDVAKRVAAMKVVVGRPREVLLLGRLSRVPWVADQLARRLGGDAPVRRVEGYATVAKEAAQGAALIADGLLGGEPADLVDAMRLREASGTALDHVYVNGMDDVRRRFRVSEPGPAPFWEGR